MCNPTADLLAQVSICISMDSIVGSKRVPAARLQSSMIGAEVVRTEPAQMDTSLRIIKEITKADSVDSQSSPITPKTRPRCAKAG
jgi:hypothetical protein